ncbi:hypothetical protein [Streptomyces sp. RPT161]|uniref:hypothetical protein n=1 Tax=Streptomyces sp. RPT161 TaxID=3015993 RepID=UPI0022B87100|nr:hypothetical protein [Streptomyces sp. RPT161]
MPRVIITVDRPPRHDPNPGPKPGTLTTAPPGWPVLYVGRGWRAGFDELMDMAVRLQSVPTVEIEGMTQAAALRARKALNTCWRLLSYRQAGRLTGRLAELVDEYAPTDP